MQITEINQIFNKRSRKTERGSVNIVLQTYVAKYPPKQNTIISSINVHLAILRLDTERASFKQTLLAKLVIYLMRSMHLTFLMTRKEIWKEIWKTVKLLSRP